MDKTVARKSCYHKKNIAITMGDPGGVGPELALSLFTHHVSQANNLIFIGIPEVFDKAKKLLNLDLNINLLNSDVSNFKKDYLNILDINFKDKLTYCSTSANNGKAAYLCIKNAIQLCLNKKVESVVTAPISKLGLKLAGIDFPGHTEIFAKFTNTEKFRMLFLSKKFNVLLHTIHIPLKDVSKNILKNSLEDTVKLAVDFAIKNFKKCPLIYVAGLNPHAGESGNIGREEEEIIKPVLKKYTNENIRILGPFPPDTLFFKALEDKPDIIIAMYHDQGLIPVKLTDFHGAVNVTIGIPFIRTSPDHGTAFDIAWKKIANNKSFINAVTYASILIP